MSELLTADEVAEKLRVRPDTVRGWAREGKIPSIRLSHKVVRFDGDAVVQALTEREERRVGA